MNATSVLTILFNKGVHISTQDDELVIDAPKGVLQSEDVMLIREHRDDIVDLLRQIQLEREPAVPVARAEHRGHAPLSDIQQNVLLMESLAPTMPYGNIPLAFTIDGPLDAGALGRSLDTLIATHEILRTTYVAQDERTVQAIAASGSMPLVLVDLERIAMPEAALEATLRAHEIRQFDLSREWPVRAILVKLSPTRHALGLVFHQVAMDGHSCQLFVRYLSQSYSQLVAGSQAPPAPFEGHQYVDFADWQRRERSTANYSRAVTFWKESMTGAPLLHGMPGDFLRPAVQTFAGQTFETALSAAHFAAVDRLAREHETSTFVVLQAVFALLVARYSGEHDIVTGTAVANRTRREFFGTLGNLVNTLAFRFDLETPRTFVELLEHARSVIDRAMQHQQVPFNVIVDQARPARSFSHNPLVQLMLVIQEEEQTRLRLAELAVTPIFRDPRTSKFDLTLHVYKQAGGAALRWEYNTALFREATVATFARHFQELLLDCVASPERALDALPLRVDAGRLEDAANASMFPAPQCVDRLIAHQAAQTPRNVAVRDARGELTYAELERQAEFLANHLRARRPADAAEFRVGIYCERSTRLVVAMLATLKAGGVYVPLDPAYPEARVRFMLEDAGVALVLGDRALQPPTSLPVLDVAELLTTEAAAPAVSIRDPADSAYVIYTSGSTGKPKGVLVSHRSLFYSLLANKELMRFEPGDTMPCLGSQAFGVSLLEILIPLVSGGSVRMLERDVIRDLDRLIDATQDATVLHAVPSLMAKWQERLREQAAERYPKLRLLLVGGEPVPNDLLLALRAFRPRVELIELYGMTESAVVCASYLPAADYAAHYCIGRPHATTRFHVFNRHMQLQPTGVAGELHIGGLTLATEYLNQAQTTREKFIANPLAPGERVYKTGDRVRLLPDGQYEFLGRVDHQVSLRGVRIELGEIEALLATNPAVKKALAHVVTMPSGERALVAFYTTHAAPADVGALDDALREHLARFLPDYMRPAMFQHLAEMPLNANGKIDRKELPAPRLATRAATAQTDTELRLLDLWRSLLQLAPEHTGVADNFFEMGGNSLLGTQLVNQAKKHFDIDLPVTALFEAPTVRGLASLIDRNRERRDLSLVRYESRGEALAANEMVI